MNWVKRDGELLTGAQAQESWRFSRGMIQRFQQLLGRKALAAEVVHDKHPVIGL